jgi:hypothetical protein
MAQTIASIFADYLPMPERGIRAAHWNEPHSHRLTVRLNGEEIKDAVYADAKHGFVVRVDKNPNRIDAEFRIENGHVEILLDGVL